VRNAKIRADVVQRQMFGTSPKTDHTHLLPERQDDSLPLPGMRVATEIHEAESGGGAEVTLTFGSLFVGIGGFDLGFERAGMTCTWQVEINDYCNKVLAKHWPDVRRYKDVRECGAHNLEPVDVICGGFPCQPHSVAGKRKGAADDRNLWPEFLRVVREVRPTWVVAENVPGIVSLYLDTVLSDLEDIGYTATTFDIPACAFDAPHRRERIFVVANADTMRLPHAANESRNGQGWQNAAPSSHALQV